MSQDWQVVLELQDLLLPARGDIEGAYRRLARVRHPDLGGTAEAMAELSQARAEALAWLEGPHICQECAGKGYAPLGGGFSPARVRCQTCAGTGVIKGAAS